MIRALKTRKIITILFSSFPNGSRNLFQLFQVIDGSIDQRVAIALQTRSIKKSKTKKYFPISPRKNSGKYFRVKTSPVREDFAWEIENLARLVEAGHLLVFSTLEKYLARTSIILI
jgi:hypothetical protein